MDYVQRVSLHDRNELLKSIQYYASCHSFLFYVASFSIKTMHASVSLIWSTPSFFLQLYSWLLY
jgi:hypothetical protein